MRLSHGCSFIRGRVFTVRGRELRPLGHGATARAQSSVRVDTARPRGQGMSARTHSFPSSPSRELPSPLPYGRTLLSPRTQTLKKKNLFLFLFFIFYFLVVVAGLKREKKKFGFQSPRSPRSPSSVGFAGKAARRRRFFRPSSPSHPSKLYSSLGLLNSKVPKPFSILSKAY
jgi:hypothetical protein